MTEVTTPEARLISYHVQRLSPVPTAAQMAMRFGWSTEKWGDIMRGRRRARKGQPAPRPHRPTDADLARIAVELSITPGELEEIGRPEAAERLRGSALPVPVTHGPDPARVERLFGLLIRKYPEAEREPLELFWRRSKPLDERMDAAIEYLEDLVAYRAENRKTG